MQLDETHLEISTVTLKTTDSDNRAIYAKFLNVLSTLYTIYYIH